MDFLPQTREVRTSEWTVAPAPANLDCIDDAGLHRPPRLQLSPPCSLRYSGWQWVQNNVRLDTGETATPQFVWRILDEDLAAIRHRNW
jgi:hypothetical protein